MRLSLPSTKHFNTSFPCLGMELCSLSQEFISSQTDFALSNTQYGGQILQNNLYELQLLF